jgi:hypothetical protein
MTFEGIHIQLIEESLYKVFLVRPDFENVIIDVESQNYIIPEATETKTPYYQYSPGQGFFLGENYKIQPMPQPDADITAATGWTTSTVFTFDELVAEAAGSPAAGNYGHIELYYYYNEVCSHNISYMTIELTNSVVKTIYSFVYTT